MVNQAAKAARIKIDTNSTWGLWRLVIIGGVGIIGVALVISMIKKSRKMASGSQVVENEDVATAMELNTAIHPSRNWFGNLFTGADRDQLFILASKIKNFDDVASEYQNLYDESLSHELQDALGEEYPDFLAKLNKVAAGTDSTSTTELKSISDALYADMKGLNFSGHDLNPYSKLYRLSDTDFKRTITIYNTEHKPDFRSMLEDESGTSGLIVLSVAFDAISQNDFETVKQKVLQRYDKLYK